MTVAEGRLGERNRQVLNNEVVLRNNSESEGLGCGLGLVLVWTSKNAFERPLKYASRIVGTSILYQFPWILGTQTPPDPVPISSQKMFFSLS